MTASANSPAPIPQQGGRGNQCAGGRRLCRSGAHGRQVDTRLVHAWSCCSDCLTDLLATRWMNSQMPQCNAGKRMYHQGALQHYKHALSCPSVLRTQYIAQATAPLPSQSSIFPIDLWQGLVYLSACWTSTVHTYRNTGTVVKNHFTFHVKRLSTPC